MSHFVIHLKLMRHCKSATLSLKSYGSLTCSSLAPAPRHAERCRTTWIAPSLLCTDV